MLDWLGRLAVRARRRVLAVTLLAVVAAGVVGGGVAERLSTGGFVDADAESTQAAALLDERFDAGDSNFVLVLTGPAGSTVDDAAIRGAGSALTARLGREPGVLQVNSYWTLGESTSLRSRDSRSAVVLARLAGNEDEVRDTARTLRKEYRDQDGLTIRATGSSVIYGEMTDILEEDLIRADLYAFPLTLLLLLAIFGSLVAAGIPLLLGMVSVVGTLLVLTVLAALTDVSVFALNLTTALGLGLAIDYSLFIVSRFREELAAGAEPDEAVRRTVRTAGRTVIYSALTVALSLSALLLFPLYFLRSFAYAGVAVVLLAALAAVLVLPAALAILGHRVNRLAVGRRIRHQRSQAAGRRPPFWERVAFTVMRRPLPVATAVVAVLLVLGLPFLDVRFGLPDDRMLPADAHSRQASDFLRSQFSARETEPVSVVSPEQVDPAKVHAYSAALSRIPEAARVDAITGSYQDGRQIAPPAPASARFGSGDGTWLSVVPDVETYSPEGERLVQEVRAAPAPAPMLVGGRSAELVDIGDAITDRLPLTLGLMAATVGVLLFLFTGSVLIPIKALVMNLLSLSATFGAMVWIFQEGHLRWLVGDFAVTHTLDVTMPILMFCVAFGLSMDYEVFLLSRIREEWDRVGDNATAVAYGLGRTGGLITGAALIVAVVFLAFVTSGVTFLKLLGFGLALAVLVDVTLIRGALVPAFMYLAGRANWWAPAPLRSLHARFRLMEPAPPPPPSLPPVSNLPAPERYVHGPASARQLASGDEDRP